MSRGMVRRRHRKSCPRNAGAQTCTCPWEYRVELPRGEDKRRVQITKGGFARERDAQRALHDLIGKADKGTYDHASRNLTVAEYLDEWLAGKGDIRDGTRRSYTQHIEHYLKPHLGTIKLAELRAGHIDAMFAKIRKARPKMKDATRRRILATLKSALNAAIKRRYIDHNPALAVELASGERPEVTVWTAEEYGKFLKVAAPERLYPAFALIGRLGLRRGEALGLRWSDVDLNGQTLTVSQSLTQLGTRLVFGPPKTKNSRRVLPLSNDDVAMLKAWRKGQATEQLQWGEAYHRSDLVFTREDGRPVDPSWFTKRFLDISKQAELPRIRLHDLRHTAASRLIAAGVNPKLISAAMGHSGIGITMDTYGHLMDKDQLRVAYARADALREAN